MVSAGDDANRGATLARQLRRGMVRWSGSGREEEWSRMDDRRFDQLARAIAGEAGSRRAALGFAAGSAVAALVGFFGLAETADAQRRNQDGNRDRNRDRDRRRRRRRDEDKKVKVCHCPDTNQNNCKTKSVTEKERRRHLKRHPNDKKGRCKKNQCNDFDTECNVNRPGECCAGACCIDTTSSLGGVCPTLSGNCCGQHFTGGYCTAVFPQCCGQHACCRANEVCCSNVFDPLGYCCPAGQVCDANQPNGCRQPAPPAGMTSATAEGTVRAGAPRMRAGG
jgi:hypothetical protein